MAIHLCQSRDGAVDERGACPPTLSRSHALLEANSLLRATQREKRHGSFSMDQTAQRLTLLQTEVGQGGMKVGTTA